MFTRLKNPTIIFLWSLLFACQQTNAAEIKFSDDKGRHESLATAQVLLMTGCEGKLSLSEKRRRQLLTTADHEKLQTCTDNASTDIAGNIQAAMASGQLQQSRIINQTLHEAVLFAKRWNAPLSAMQTETILEQARVVAIRIYPFPARVK